MDNRSGESSEGAWRRAANLTGEKLEWYKQQPYYSEERKNYAPRYALLRQQLGYDGHNSAAEFINWPDVEALGYNKQSVFTRS